MTSSYSKTPVFVRQQVKEKWAFSKSSTLESIFEKLLLRDRLHRILEDGGQNRRKNIRFQTKTDTCGQALNLLLFAVIVDVAVVVA